MLARFSSKATRVILALLILPLITQCANPRSIQKRSKRPPSVKQLIEQAQSADRSESYAAVLALQVRGREAVPELIKSLRAKNQLVSKTCQTELVKKTKPLKKFEFVDVARQPKRWVDNTPKVPGKRFTATNFQESMAQLKQSDPSQFQKAQAIVSEDKKPEIGLISAKGAPASTVQLRRASIAPVSVSIEETLIGAKWVGEDSDGEFLSFDFRPGGVVFYRSGEGGVREAQWTLIGEKVEIVLNQGYSRYRGFFEGAQIVGAAVNKRQETWEWSVQRK